MTIYSIFEGNKSKIDIQCAECGDIVLEDTFTNNNSNEIFCSRLCATIDYDGRLGMRCSDVR